MKGECVMHQRNKRISASGKRFAVSRPAWGALLAAAFLAAGTRADTPPEADKYWAQWRGPLASGVAPHGDPPAEWSESKNVRWKIEIPGDGLASPIVWGDRVYVLTTLKTEKTVEAKTEKEEEPRDQRRGRRAKPTNVYQFAVLALDRKTGKTVWQRVVHEQVPLVAVHQDSTNASASPVTDGERVYAFFGSYGLYCLDADGKVLWEKDLGDMRTTNDFGEGSSPVLYGDTLVVKWDHEGEDFLAAFDKKTGQEKWRVKRDEPTTWFTPLIVEINGRPQIITSGTKQVAGYDLADGKLLWRGKGLTANVIPSPVYGDGIAYLISGFRGNMAKAVRLSAAADDIDQNGAKAIVWTYDKNTPYVPSPLLYGDLLYFLDNNKGILTCLNAKTGEKHYGPQRLEGVKGVYASLVGAAQRVYIADRDGQTTVLKNGPQFEVLATNKLDDNFDASPAIAGNEIFLRGRKHLYCIAKE